MTPTSASARLFNFSAGPAVLPLPVLGNTVGYDTKTHERVFRYPSPGYTPMISDGVRLFLVGYESVHAFEPKQGS